MKNLAVACFILGAVLAAAAPPTEFQPRGGTPNFLAKARGDAALRIGYLGGSITAADGWRPKTLKWFQQKFPAAKFSEINAAIGGTGSDLGVFRLQRDVLDHQPDLLFVEFAVNDGGAAREQIHRAMEGIVRQIWRAFPDCDICFVYTIAGNMLETTQAGKLPRSVEAMEELAAHYQIPSINFGLEVARLEKEGKLVFKAAKPTNDVQRAALADKMVFSSDAVHPHADTGHELYRQAVARAFDQLAANPATPAKHALGTPLRADNWEQAKLVPLNAKLLTGSWTLLDATNKTAKSFAKRLPELWRATQPGDALQFKFRGTSAAVYDLLGPDCGQLRLTLDGKDMGLRPRFDSYCTYHRLGSVSAGSTLSNTVHEVRLTLDPAPLDKAKILAQRNEKIDSPKRFEPAHWYAGALMIVGELVP
jgi:lysophospholipase L1-like esterase